MNEAQQQRIVEAMRAEAAPLEDLDPLLEQAKDAKLVLLGEATHGSDDLYRQRARITQALIEQHGFRAVVVEADWPDAAQVSRWVRGRAPGGALDSLSGFERFPTWMWRNRAVLEFVQWLRGRNDAHAQEEPVYFLGMDLYSMHRSARAVVDYLQTVDPDAARRVRERYACLHAHGEDAQAYGWQARFDQGGHCERAALQVLRELQERAASGTDPDLLSAEQNARLAKNAETYYRTMFGSPEESWNVRDRHMFETLEWVVERLGDDARLIVWAHNSHLGDARATEFARRGELNVGQLVRQRWGPQAFLVGFTQWGGSVTAAHEWDDPPQRMRVTPAVPGSLEDLAHRTGVPRFSLLLRNPGEALGGLREQVWERAIGVIYRPRTELASHYFKARPALQFDALVHVDVAKAVEPLDPPVTWSARDEEPPEAYPSGL